MFEGQGREMEATGGRKTRKLLVELGLGVECESEAVGTKQHWGHSNTKCFSGVSAHSQLRHQTSSQGFPAS